MNKNVKARVGSANTNSAYKANRYDTKANWTTANPILNKGEIVIEVDGSVCRLKCGNGTSNYNDLDYITAEADVYTGDDIGDVTYTIAPTIPANKHALDGSSNLRENYAGLWSWLEANPAWLKTETEWQSIANSNNGQCTYYSKGDEWSTFRFPKVTASVGKYVVELVGGGTDSPVISVDQYEYIMQQIGQLQSDVDTVESKVNTGTVKAASLTDALRFTKIPVNSDLNDYNQAGLYCCAQNAEVQTLKNVPEQQSFFLFVLTQASNNRPTQLWVNYSSGVMYVRPYYDWEPVGWQSWKKVGGS